MKKKLLILVLILVLVSVLAVAGGAFWVSQQLQPVTYNSDELPDQEFIIKKGESVASIGNRLQGAGLIKNARVFSYMVRYYKLTPKIQAGTFMLSPAQTPKAIAETFTNGTEDLWVTLLEGWRAEEMADYLGNQESLTDFDKENFIFLAKPLEGSLYPDTYLVPKEIDEETMIELLTTTFEAKTKDILNDMSASEQNEVLTMASIVQREAKAYEDMRRVAGILFNRIEIGMPLQADATLQYVKGYNKAENSWWVPPLAADKQLNSAYNTYLNQGLPPRPISNPSLDAIKATIDPLESDDLYYIHAPDGTMYYAEDLNGHNANVNRYLR